MRPEPVRSTSAQTPGSQAAAQAATFAEGEAIALALPNGDFYVWIYKDGKIESVAYSYPGQRRMP